MLRIEDTDQNRLVAGSAENLRRMLEWSGIQIDEGPPAETSCDDACSGNHGPYVQSERLSLYREHVDRLVEKGHAYPCFCSPERLSAMRKAQKRRGGGAAIYDRRCHVLPADEVASRLESGESHVIRMLVPPGSTVVDDAVIGRTEFAHENIDDQILLKSDGFPTYHLANVVDDHLMDISHVIRGEEWLPSTPKHQILYEAFGWKLPVFAHLPLLLNPGDRSKLSKRQGDVAVEDYASKGFPAPALCNFVALLGWNPGDGETQEFFTLEDLENRFQLEDINKGGAVVDQDRLSWLSSRHVKHMAEEDLAGLALATCPFIVEKMNQMGLAVRLEGFDQDFPSSKDMSRNSDTVCISRERLETVVSLMRDRARTLVDIADLCEPFFIDPHNRSAESSIGLDSARRKMWNPRPPGLIESAHTALRKSFSDGSKDFSGVNVKKVLKSVLKDFEAKDGDGHGKVKMKDLFLPLRFAVTGRGGGADLMETMELIGGEACMKRLERLLARDDA